MNLKKWKFKSGISMRQLAREKKDKMYQCTQLDINLMYKNAQIGPKEYTLEWTEIVRFYLVMLNYNVYSSCVK